MAVGPFLAHPADMPFETELFQSERDFLAAGSRSAGLSGATLWHMPAFRDVPEAAAVQDIDTGSLDPDPLSWLVAVESTLDELGICQSRLRLDRPPAELEISLSLLGYQPRREIALVRPAAPLGTDVTLIQVRDDAEWQRRLEFQMTMESEDGVDPARRVEFERAKFDAGCIASWLAIRDGRPVASVNTSQVGTLLRIRDLVVAETPRSRGATAAVLAAMVRLAHIRGLAAAALFATSGSNTDAASKVKNFTPIGSHTTWLRELAEITSERRAGGLSPWAMERMVRKQGMIPHLSKFST